MPDAESFVAAIAANPADDLPRLVFADWLDEHGDPARAGFIRDHVRLAKLRPGTDEYKALFRKCADTLRANLPAWIKPACDAFNQPAEWRPGKAVGGRFPIRLDWTHAGVLRCIEFNRGLIDFALLNLITAPDPTPCERLFRMHPITRLKAALPLSPSAQWSALKASECMGRVRTLEMMPAIAAPIPIDDKDVAAEFFNSPGLQAVSRISIGSVDHVRALVQSALARRLISLGVVSIAELITQLAEYPLDDRLQEFAVHQYRRHPRMSATSPELWSAVSRVSFRPTLKRLDLTRCGMTDDGLAAFARGEEWVRLQGLKLGGNLFGDRGWADFCRGWRTPELTYLDASRNRLTDSGAEMLGRSGMLKTLRVIDLRGNRIAGRGAVALARAVAEGKVNRLLLAGNPLHKRDAATVKGLLGERVDVG